MRGNVSKVVGSVDFDELVHLTKKLVSIPSHAETEGKEKGVVNYVIDYLDEVGCETSLQKIGRDRGNVIGVLKGSGSGKSLMLNGHMDTVPPSGMKEPLNAEIEDDKLFGRGTCDMKGALAAMMVVMKTISKRDITLEGDLIFAATVEEETGALGMDRLMEDPPFDADYCITGEPTSLDIGVAHKGIEWIQVTTIGSAAHGSTPHQGDNAISKMANFIRELEESLIPKLNQKSHPLLGSPTINIGQIKGGKEINIVPNTCTLGIDRRWLPGESIEGVMEEIYQVVEQIRRKNPGFEAEINRIEDISKVWHGPFQASDDNPLIELTREATKKHASFTPKNVGLNFWTDGALAQRNGVETLIYGPGNATEAHTENEYVELRKLKNSAKVYTEIGLRVCAH